MAKAASSSAPSGDAPSWGLAFLRLYVGWVLMSAGYAKVVADTGAAFVTAQSSRIAASPNWYRWFGEDVVLANPGVFAFLIQWGELVGGVLLFLGALTRPVGIAVAFMMLNFYFCGPVGQQGYVLLMLVCALVCAISRAGHRMGLDGWVGESLPRAVTW
ncbi:MAG: DoxX family protein [Planctomycetes bacterium]|nr:DoxX family protein [Planctomycetota bacterium]